MNGFDRLDRARQIELSTAAIARDIHRGHALAWPRNVTGIPARFLIGACANALRSGVGWIVRVTS